jgi:class 3 adenylate cyclase/tetratricopeptide (TPR) repeat protein
MRTTGTGQMEPAGLIGVSGGRLLGVRVESRRASATLDRRSIRCSNCSVSVSKNDAFCRSCGARLPSSSSPLSESADERTAAYSEISQSELRILTVMFADLVESTVLATQLDPEDFRKVILAVQRLVSEVVARFGGTISSYVGDGALISFGYPIALEDHAERAVRAGITLTGEITALTLFGWYQPRIRVGIATGLVAIGDVLGSFGRAEQMMAGESANLAARLMSVADPNSILISSTTQQLCAGFFEYQGPFILSLKGFPGPVHAWRPFRASNAEGRFQALRPSTLTNLVGREEEVEQLMQLWRAASRRAGQVVLLTGEAGIGKSRLAIELQHRLQPENHLAVRYFCLPHREASPLQPIKDRIERAAGFEISDPPDLRIAKLDRMLAPFLYDTRVNRSAIAELLGLPTEGAESLTPQQRKEMTLRALLAIIESLAEQSPLLLCFEDAHWSDPTSLELIGLLVERVSNLKVMVLVTARPEFVADWKDHPTVTSLAVSRLDHIHSTRMFERIPGAASIAANDKRDILARADGIPLFLEELTKAVLEHRSSKGPSRDSPQPIPVTLHASLLARLDRLKGVREIAQTAAAIGRDFSIDVLGAVTTLSSTSLRVALDTLVSAELVSMTGPTPARSYRFKHALVRDAAYGSMLREQRQALHVRIVEALERRFPETVATQPDVLARHCASAKLTAKSIAYWLRAGSLAVAGAAMAEASTALTEGLRLVAELAEGDDRDRMELELQLALSRSEIATKGYAAHGVGETLTKARQLCERLGGPPEYLSVLYGLWTHALMRTELRQARRLSEVIMRLGEARHVRTWSARGCRLAGLTCIARGQYQAAREHLERGLEIYDSTETSRRSSFVLYDTQVMLRTFLGIALFELGSVRRARADWRAALTEARGSEHRFTLPYALTQTVMADLEIDDFVSALRGAEELIEHSEVNEVSFFWGIGMNFRGRCLVAQGHADDGFKQIELGLAAYRKTQATLWLPSQLALIADACGSVGSAEEGLRRLVEATNLIAEAGEHYAASTVYRVRGELLVLLGEFSSGVASLRRSLTIARRQNGRVLQLRAALSIARHEYAQGKKISNQELMKTLLSSEIAGLNAPAFREAQMFLSA